MEHLGISYSDFQIPDCPACLSENHKNNVVSVLKVNICVHTPTDGFIAQTTGHILRGINTAIRQRNVVSPCSVRRHYSSTRAPRYHFIDTSDRLLVVGTTLATYSAFRWAPTSIYVTSHPSFAFVTCRSATDYSNTRSIHTNLLCSSTLAQHAQMTSLVFKKSTIPLDRYYVTLLEAFCTSSLSFRV